MPPIRRLLRLSARVVVVWVVLSALVIGFGRQGLAGALPMLDRVVNLVQEDFVATVEIVQDAGEWVLRIQPVLVRPVRLNAELSLPPGTRLRRFVTHVDHTLVPPLLFLLVLFAWPASRWRELAVRLLLAVPVLVLVLALTAPILLVGQVQMVLTDLKVMAGDPFRQPALVRMMVFMESGGRWLLALAGGVVCIAAARWLLSGTTPAASRPAAA